MRLMSLATDMKGVMVENWMSEALGLGSMERCGNEKRGQ